MNHWQGPQRILALHMASRSVWVGSGDCVSLEVAEIGEGAGRFQPPGQVDISVNGDNLGTPAFRVAHVHQAPPCAS